MKNQTFLLLLSALVLLVSAQPSTQIISTFQPYTDLNSTTFQNILAYAKKIHPQVNQYQVFSVSYLNFNGFKYNITLKMPFCTLNIIVFVTYDGWFDIYQFDDYLQCSNPNPGLGPVCIDKVILNPSGDAFNNALAQALAKLPSLTKGDLVLTQTSCQNYIFTFRKLDGSLKRLVVDPNFVLFGNGQNPSPAVLGGYQEITNKSDLYTNALKAILNAYPIVIPYRITYVASQVVDGMNYKFTFDNNSLDRIRYATFKVYISLTNQVTIDLVSWIDIGGYSVATIIYDRIDSIEKHPQLVGTTLTTIENIWPGSEGIKFFFRGENATKYSVFIFKYKGQILNLIY